MKNHILLFFLFFCFIVKGQVSPEDDYLLKPVYPKTAMTLGILQGGGGIFGVDVERLIFRKLGVQAGVGFISMGCAVTWHFKRTVKSSCLALTYWHQGVGSLFTQSMLGPSFIFRGKRWFTFQVGVGKRVAEGPSFKDTQLSSANDVMLLYSIGGYLAFK